MGIPTTRCAFPLAACLLLISCAPSPRMALARPEPARTITFHNNGRERVQVYLIGQKEDWLLGRLEPLERAQLRLPASSFVETDEAVVLAVLPGWSRSLSPRTDWRAVRSIEERGSQLPGAEWRFVNGQLQGPRQRP